VLLRDGDRTSLAPVSGRPGGASVRAAAQFFAALPVS
jgi:hypothetical protein